MTLRRELIGFAPATARRAVAPKEIEFDQHLPNTRSGKIMRRLLKARELGLPEGDLSTLEVRHERRDAERRPPRPLDAVAEHASSCCAQMLRIRRFEEKCAELYSAAKIRGFLHLYIGEEAVAVGVMQRSGPDDAVVATYREHGHALARGMSMAAVMAEMFGKQTGAAAAGADRCTCSTRRCASTAATPSSAADCRSRSGSRSPTRCAARRA